MAELRQPPSVDAYGGRGFVIGGERIEGSALIVDDAARPWAPRALAELAVDDFAAALSAEHAIEFVLLGCGLRMAPPPRALREAFAARRVGLELMDTPAACRLYNVLASEGRRLAAALLAV